MVADDAVLYVVGEGGGSANSLRKPRPPRCLSRVCLGSLPEQIRNAMNSYMGRTRDLFRAMDGDESGTISRKEFVCAMQMLGLQDRRREPRLV